MIVPRPSRCPHVSLRGAHTCSPGGPATAAAAARRARDRARASRRVRVGAPVATGAPSAAARRAVERRQDLRDGQRGGRGRRRRRRRSPVRPMSWAVTAGQPGSRAAAVQLQAAEAGRAAGQHQRPDHARAVAQPDRQVRNPRRGAAPRPVTGSGAAASASTHRSGAGRRRRRPAPTPGATRRTTSSEGVGARSAAVGVQQTGAQVACADRAAGRRPRAVHRPDARQREPGRHADGERPVADDRDDRLRPPPRRPLRTGGVDERTGVDEPARADRPPPRGSAPRRTARADQAVPVDGRDQLVEHPRERRRQIVDDERGARVEAEQPGRRPAPQQRAVRRRAGAAGQGGGARAARARGVRRYGGTVTPRGAGCPRSSASGCPQVAAGPASTPPPGRTVAGLVLSRGEARGRRGPS